MDITNQIEACIERQRTAADMAIKFKALKMGASVEMINTMTVFDLLDWISDNA